MCVFQSPKEEKIPERFQPVSTMGLQRQLGADQFFPAPMTDVDMKPCIKEEPLDGDYSSMGEASCSAYGSSDSSSPDPARTAGAAGTRVNRRTASARHAGSSLGIPIDMEDQEMKKLERKRLRNRIAASKCRFVPKKR